MGGVVGGDLPAKSLISHKCITRADKPRSSDAKPAKKRGRARRKGAHRATTRSKGRETRTLLSATGRPVGKDARFAPSLSGGFKWPTISNWSTPK